MANPDNSWQPGEIWQLKADQTFFDGDYHYRDHKTGEKFIIKRYGDDGIMILMTFGGDEIIILDRNLPILFDHLPP